MAIYSAKKTSLFPKGVEDKAERGISSSRRSKLAAKSVTSLSKANKSSARAKTAGVRQYVGPRKRPIE